MFTGIVESLGAVTRIKHQGTNRHFWIESALTVELKIDQSVAHNGVCLTVVEKEGRQYRVTAIEESLKKTNLSHWKVGDEINLERCMKADGRFDGHIVQGHVDTTAQVTSIDERDGSWNFSFQLDADPKGLIVHKGSICINGVSLTVVRVDEKSFAVSIIPYTFKHTCFHRLKPGDFVNIEFDILGKYIQASLVRQGVN